LIRSARSEAAVEDSDRFAAEVNAVADDGCTDQAGASGGLQSDEAVAVAAEAL
jgi:hypothetical protein